MFRLTRSGARRSVRPRLVVAGGGILTALMVTGCDEHQAPPAVVVRDSASVRIVERPADLPVPTLTVALNPEAAIGGLAENNVPYQFTQIQGVTRLSDGRIVVADWGTKEVRYFSADGVHLLTVGGGGEGPGEVRYLFSVDRVLGDTLVVGGWPIGSRYWFDERGEFIRNQMLGPWFPGRLGRTMVDGSLLLDTYEFGSYGNTLERWANYGDEEDLRPLGIVELVSRDGARTDTIGSVYAETFHKTGVPRQNFAMHALPFTPTGLVAWSRDRVFIGHTDKPEVHAFDLDGDLVMALRWVADSVPVTSADRVAFEDEVLSSLRNPQLAPNYRRWFSEIAYPDYKPSFDALLADEDGFLWVRASPTAERTTARWMVYAPDGVPSATAELPAALDVLYIDRTHIIGKRAEDLGVETVYVYRYSG